MFGLRRKTATSKRGDPSTEGDGVQETSDADASAGPAESAAAQFTDENADNGNADNGAEQPATVDTDELSPQDALPGKDPIPLDEADIVVARDTDGSDDRPTESVQEMSDMQSDEENPGVQQPSATDSPNADKAILHIGPGTVLKGDITTCESLIVQGNLTGTVEASLMLLAHGGVVDGTVNVQAAEIEGTFTGTLTVKGLLCVKGGGKIQGTVRYGELEIERGCQLNGDISQHEASSDKPGSNVASVRRSNPAGVKAA